MWFYELSCSLAKMYPKANHKAREERSISSGSYELNLKGISGHQTIVMSGITSEQSPAAQENVYTYWTVS